MIQTLLAQLKSPSVRWLRYCVFLAAFTSISAQAIESAHVHNESSPAECWMYHAPVAITGSTQIISAAPTWIALGGIEYHAPQAITATRLLPPATGPPYFS